MKKTIKKIFLMGGLLLVSVLSSCKTTQEIKETSEETTDKAQEITKASIPAEFVEIKEDLDFLSTSISYPQFEELPEFSSKIKNITLAGWESFKTFANDNWNEIQSLNPETNYPPLEYIVKSEVYYSGDIVSVYVNTYRFSGGAHGETSITTFNYDKKSGKEINILEASGYSYEELSDISRTSLYNRLISENKFEIEGDAAMELSEMINAGTEPIAGNYQRFTLDDKKLRIYFEQYSVAPYSYGVQVVETELN